MNQKSVPLKRRFSLVPKSEADSDKEVLRSLISGGKETRWAELEKEFRCVILAEAGAGKTFEMEARARYLSERGRKAFFIRIEDINSNFESSFEVGSLDEFNDWLNSTDEAWFFLDSVDESRLDGPQRFEQAIKRFSVRIKPAQLRAHIYISTRPYAWRMNSDRFLLERHLPYYKPISYEDEYISGDMDTAHARNPAEPENALRVYMLDPLDESDIREFAEYYQTPKIDELIDELERNDLMSMAERPFDLESILNKWETDNQELGGRHELLKHNIDYRLDEIDPNRELRQPLNLDQARQGARLLAASVILTGEPGIRVPDSPRTDSGFSAKTVLSDWNPNDVQSLLERGIFNDRIYDMVRFRHREVREMLAAEWYLHLLENEDTRRNVESLFFRKQYGHSVIAPRLRPVLSWLILDDDQIRRKALAIAPEIAVEGGDPSRLPLEVRQALLGDIVKRIANNQDDDRSARGNDAIARIAKSDLEGDALRLIDEFKDNDQAIHFLGRFVWQGELKKCVPALFKIAINESRNIFARTAATGAVMTCGNRNQKGELWNHLLSSSVTLPHDLLVEIVENAEPNIVSVKSLLASIDKLEPIKGHKSYGIRQALHDFINRLELDTPTKSAVSVASTLINGLNQFLDRGPQHIDLGGCRISEEFCWLLGPAMQVVERLVSTRSKVALSPEALAVMLRMPAVRIRRSDDDFEKINDRLLQIVPEWSELNDELFWQSVELAQESKTKEGSEKLTEVWPVQNLEHYWKFEADRFDDVLEFINAKDNLDDKMITLSLAHQMFIQAERPKDWLEKLAKAVSGNTDLEERLAALLNPKLSESDMEWLERHAEGNIARKLEQERNEWNRVRMIGQISSNIDLIHDTTGMHSGRFTNVHFRLLHEIIEKSHHASRSDGANWQTLIPVYGKEVARAYRDAATEYWQHFTPGIRSEGGDTDSTYHLNFALSGLEIAAVEIDDFFADMPDRLACHALRYIVWELNGFPKWLENFHQARPDLVLDAVLAELKWELANTGPDQSSDYILCKLARYAPWLHESLASEILEWLEKNEIQNLETLRDCLQILLSGKADKKGLSSLITSKIADCTTMEHLAEWYALWIDMDAESGIPAAKQWLSELSKDEASIMAQQLITQLMGPLRTYITAYGYGSFRKAKHLKDLYFLMHEYIRTQDDIEHANMGYFPSMRDDAQDCRNALLNQLSELPGKETYHALLELAENHRVDEYRPAMKKLAHKRAQEDADLEVWSAEQVREYDRKRMMTPMTHRQLFDLTVQLLKDLKAWIEYGNDSPYKTWRRVVDEAEVRNLIAGWLNGESSGRYTCPQESELSNKQRTDISVQNPKIKSPVPIELKLLDKGWTGPNLCERLRNQLAGDYLREETAECGVFLLVWPGSNSSKEKTWEIDGRSVALEELPNALAEYWETVSSEFSGVSAIEVILIDLTKRESRISGNSISPKASVGPKPPPDTMPDESEKKEGEQK